MARWKALSKGFPTVPECDWALPHNVFWVGSCAGCALGEWATNGSLENYFQGLSNGAKGGFCGWLVLVPWSVECGLGVTRAVGLCLDCTVNGLACRTDSRVWLPVQLWFLSGGSRACAHAFAWLLVSGAREYPQAPLDVAERETPERGMFCSLSQPIWDNGHHPPPKLPPLFRDKWESLQVTVVHNTFSDRVGARHYTKEDNQAYIDTDLDHHYFQNKKINNERFLDSWEIITQHCDAKIVPFQSTKHNKPPPPARGSPEHIQITTDGEYIIYFEGQPFKATQNTLGVLTIGEALEATPDNIDPSPPTRWGK
eukprot:scaffold6328_cov131-Isochrysis_galbana.AAC.1